MVVGTAYIMRIVGWGKHTMINVCDTKNEDRLLPSKHMILRKNKNVGE